MAVSETVYDLLSAPITRQGPEVTREFLIEQLNDLIDILFFYLMDEQDIEREVRRALIRHSDDRGLAIGKE